VSPAKSGSGQRPSAWRGQPRRTEDVARSLEDLRRSIVGPERDRIEKLESRPAFDAEAVGSLLPEALAGASAKRERELATALETPVTDAVTTVARQHPEVYSEALAPTIGAAVKKAVAQAIAEMLERLNVALDRNLTIHSVRWRLEAARSGRPFAEIALLRTLVYRVEQVFLIHRPTSLVLQHLVDPSVPEQAPDQIAAMLAAIETFGREAFGPMPPDAHLSRFELGELTVCTSHDRSLTLAAAVRGTPSVGIAHELGDTLSRVHVRFAAALREFTGDVSAFDGAYALLEPLLRTERRPPRRRAQVLLLAVAIALLAGAVGLLAWKRARTVAEGNQEAVYRATFGREPGIIVDHVAWHRGRPLLSGFRDPLASPPESVLAHERLPPASFDLAPFVSLDPRIVERRAERVLQPPPGVRVQADGHRLRLTGAAPLSWARDARLLARVLPGVEELDDSGLRSQESLDALSAAARSLETVEVSFRPGQIGIDPSEDGPVADIAARARAAVRAAGEARVGACLVVTGHADSTGAEAANQSLSAQRASEVTRRLATMGVDPAVQRPVGTGAWLAQGRLARSVTVRLIVDEARYRPGCGEGP
jgi:OOP family OmpA-OmpF porin